MCHPLVVDLEPDIDNADSYDTWFVVHNTIRTKMHDECVL